MIPDVRDMFSWLGNHKVSVELLAKKHSLEIGLWDGLQRSALPFLSPFLSIISSTSDTPA